jgi:hypothetical protein
MKLIKIFFIQLFIIYRLFFGKLVFSQGEDDKGGTGGTGGSGDEGNADAARRRLGVQTLEVHAGSPTGQEVGEVDTGGEGENEEEKAARLKAEEEATPAGGQASAVGGDGVDGTGDEGSIKLGDLEINQAEFEELYNEAVKELGDEFKDLPENMQKTLLGDRLKTKDKNRQIDKKSQQQAAKSKELLVAETDLAIRQKKLDEYENNLKLQKEEAQKIAALDPDEEADDTKRRRMELEKYDAEKALKRIEQEELLIKDERARQSLDKQINLYMAAKELLINTFPDDFKIDGDYEDINEQLEEKKFTGKKYEAQIVLRFKRVYNEYMSQSDTYRKNNTIAEFYELNKDAYPEIKRDDKKAGELGKNGQQKDVKVTSAKELFQKLKQGQAGSPPPPGGTGAQLSGIAGKGGSKQTEMSKKAKERLIKEREAEP